jgi:hypothetical protein
MIFDNIVPIEIRPGVFVHIAPIPHDLTRAEAEKISRVVLAFASDRDGAREGGDANAAPVPQDRQARAEGIAQLTPGEPS